MHEVVQFARAIDDNGLRAEVLASLLDELPEADRPVLALEILEALELTTGSKSYD
ncbi:MAG: hypothetical protein GTO14_22470 [Anaerolineales bacterium]|nr:hypothetical protein [Anaerolineales bacterium]